MPEADCSCRARGVTSAQVALDYDQLPDREIAAVPVRRLLPDEGGFVLLWVINSRFSFGVHLLEQWGCTLVDTITWIKTTKKRRIAKGHGTRRLMHRFVVKFTAHLGFYLQHAKEECLVGAAVRCAVPSPCTC